tara:strand:- start:293 stop:514 length:222 start_codon:yes stop_codon:yes gene_type:complete
VKSNYSHRQKLKVIAPTGDGRKSFALFQYRMIMEHNRRDELPLEYYDQIIELLEELEEYEKCNKLLEVRNLIK